MNQKKQYYTAGELAQMFKLSKQTLLYYDRIKLLQPEFVEDNGYRYYSLHQYLALEVITNLRKLDIPIEEIKDYLDNRSPEAMSALLERQDKKCQEIIEQNQNVRKDIALMFKQLEEIHETCTDQITLNFRHAKRLYMSKLSAGTTGHMGTIFVLAKHNMKVFSKHHFKERNVGWVVDSDAFLEGRSVAAKAYFSKISDNYYDENEEYYTTPAGLHMTMRFKGTFHANKRMLALRFREFMEKNGLRPAGDLFVLPLKNHWTSKNQEDYISQITMHVEPIEEE